MKSILLYANEDKGIDQRLDAALCLSSQFDCLVNCVQVTPYNAFIMGDPFGGIYALPTVVEHVSDAETAHRSRVEDALRQQRVRWEWQNYEGHPGHVLVERSRLADLTIASLPERNASDPLSIAAGLAIHSRTPVLAMPVKGKPFTCGGEAVVAWNGSMEAAFTLRCAVPLLKHASAVHLVTVGGDKATEPQQEALHYLLQHGIHAEAHEPFRGEKSVADALLRAAAELDAHFIVAGAYGHSRFRETIFGGVTRDLIANSKIPLLLAH